MVEAVEDDEDLFTGQPKTQCSSKTTVVLFSVLVIATSLLSLVLDSSNLDSTVLCRSTKQRVIVGRDSKVSGVEEKSDGCGEERRDKGHYDKHAEDALVKDARLKAEVEDNELDEALARHECANRQ